MKIGKQKTNVTTRKWSANSVFSTCLWEILPTKNAKHPEDNIWAGKNANETFEKEDTSYMQYYIYIYFFLSLPLSLSVSLSLSLCLSLSIKNNGDIHTHSINVYTLVLQEPLRFCSSPSTPQNHPSKVELEQGYAYRNETVYSMIFHLIAPKARLITSFC